MDEIRRKLALIDDQLAGRSLHGRLMSAAPLFLPAVGLMVGIMWQNAIAGHFGRPGPAFVPRVWLVLLAIGSGLTVAHMARSRASFRPALLGWGLLFCFACLGAVRLFAFEQGAPWDIRHRAGTEPVLATVRGRVVTAPREARRDWCFAELAFTDPSSAFYLRMEEIRTPAGRQRTCGIVRVQVDEPVPNLTIGDRIQAHCWLHGFEGPTNPGQFDFAEYLRLRNIHVGAAVPAREAIEVCDAGPPDILTTLRKAFTHAATQGLLDEPPVDTQGEAILEALLLGERRHVDRDTYEAFRRTGLLHLISLSGMHLSILIGMVWWAGKPAGLSKRGRAVVCMLATAVFLLVVPPRPPTLRAAVIVWALCLSVLLRRRARALNSLALAAIILLLIRPTQLFDVGWQLSFAAVGGILAFTRPMEDFLRETIPIRIDAEPWKSGIPVWILRKLGGGALRLFLAGLAAWLGSAGILLYHFYNITPLAGLWTVLVSLPVMIILGIGFLKIIVALLIPTLGALLGQVLAVVTEAFIGLVRLAAEVDFSYMLIGRVPGVLVILYYVLILFAAFVHLRRPILKRSLCTAMALVLVSCLVVMKWQRTHRRDLSLTCLDVGHGQAILVQLPGTENLLFDAGSLYGDDAGSRIVVPCLDRLGVGRLHAVVVSHPDIDHVNGIPEVVDRRQVDRVWVEEISRSRGDDSQTATLLEQHLEKRGVPVQPMPRCITSGPAEIRVLWPIDDIAGPQELSDNDKSLVCLLAFAGRKVVLCSDIERLAQQEIVRRYPELKADIVVVPHHGSKRTLDPAFLEQLAPALLLCSCSQRDYEQGRITGPMPAAEWLITGRDGAITVGIDRAGVVKTSVHKPIRSAL